MALDRAPPRVARVELDADRLGRVVHPDRQDPVHAADAVFDDHGAIRAVHARDCQEVVLIAPEDPTARALGEALHLCEGEDVGVVVEAQSRWAHLAIEVRPPEGPVTLQRLLQAVQAPVVRLHARQHRRHLQRELTFHHGVPGIRRTARAMSRARRRCGDRS